MPRVLLLLVSLVWAIGVAHAEGLLDRINRGDTISFAENDIADWMYLDDRRMKGNFTACALLKHEQKRDAADFKKKYGLDCD